MNALLICPSVRPSVALLSESEPLAVRPLLGETLLTYWLVHLAGMGVERVWVLTQDRPEQVEAVAGGGERWGLHLEVIATPKELTPAEAWERFGAENALVVARDEIVLIDHLPGCSAHSLLTSYGDWFAQVLGWIHRAVTPDRVGFRELSPGVWAALQAHISRRARLQAPCWIGPHAIIGPGTVIGPDAVVENGAVIEAEASVIESYVGRDTLVGRFTRVGQSIACGSLLIDWRTASWTQVPDPFLLGALRPSAGRRSESTLPSTTLVPAPVKNESWLPWKQLLMNKGG